MYNSKMFHTLFETSLKCGSLAQDLQSAIVNEGKVIASEADDSDRIIAMRNAKTKADVAIQDILLLSFLEFKDDLSLDVEEESSMIREFHNSKHECTLVIDPIDGTLEYIEQKDDYSICSAIIEHGDMKCAIVYFPNLKKLYAYEHDLGVNLYNINEHGEPIKDDIIKRVNKVPNKVYVNRRVSDEYKEMMITCGYDVESDDQILCPNALVNCLNGDALAYVGVNRNIRDILVGVMIEKSTHGYAYDMDFNKLRWLQGGRQPFVIFTIYDKNSLWKK